MFGIFLKSTSDFGKRRQFVWRLIRPFIPPKMRWFFEGHPKVKGQLWVADRKLLYYTVRTYKPQYCFEIGTWRGGGSTLFISQALYENGTGKLYTVEIDENYFNEARENYQIYLPHLVPYVEFYLGDYREIYPRILNSVRNVDLLFLDGPEDASETMEQFNFFLPYMRKGSLLIAHDWFTEKCRLLKPFIEESVDWEIKKVLVPPRSLGCALAIKK
ncbi:MAG: class I SAM-dependent methyltransferase [Thermoplasmatales archaeon]